jgi:tetratricopeptide (TPR) repeat protein
MTLEQIRERVRIVANGEERPARERARRELLEVYGLFASEYAYLPLGKSGQQSAVSGQPEAGNGRERVGDTIPYLEFALAFARKETNRLVHSHGAIQCLQKLLELVTDDGFILINDYGQAEIKGAEDFEHQRFSLATFVGVNFPLLKEYFEKSGERIVDCDAETGRIDNPSYGGAGRPVMYEPFGRDSGGIHSRLLSRAAARETVLRFQTCFGRAEYDRIHEPLNKAREAVKVGRFEMAASLYREALRRQPRNWVLLSEISNFVTFSLRDPKAGADMAKLAIKLNPACSSDLWCTLGDALFEWGRTAEARSAYHKALAINPNDVRARFNLAFVHTRDKNYRAALAMIADALALDKTGQYRERLLQKQAEVLQLVTLKNQQEFLLMVNLVSKPETETRNPKQRNEE